MLMMRAERITIRLYGWHKRNTGQIKGLKNCLIPISQVLPQADRVKGLLERLAWNDRS